MSDEVEAQRRLKTAIPEGVRDLKGAEHLAHALIEAGFDIIAGQHRPTELTPADRAAIRDNHADATPTLIASRAVDEAGLAEVVAVAETYARIPIDCSPLPHWKADFKQDQKRDAGLLPTRRREQRARVPGGRRWKAAPSSGSRRSRSIATARPAGASRRVAASRWRRVVRNSAAARFGGHGSHGRRPSSSGSGSWRSGASGMPSVPRTSSGDQPATWTASEAAASRSARLCSTRSSPSHHRRLLLRCRTNISSGSLNEGWSMLRNCRPDVLHL